MGYTNFVNGSTVLKDATLNEMQKGLMQLVFPIRFYIHNTNRCKSSDYFRLLYMVKIKR